MGLSFYLTEPHTDETVFNDNITHNLTKMAQESNLYLPLWRPYSLNIKYAKDLVPHLSTGLAELISNPDKYTQYNSPNGWGTYQGLVRFTTAIYIACLDYPDTLIEVGR